ncbi:hypothetical protein [Streptomyces bohaiensis]|uniref:hypothetical protein n=1 Tax=Streptomyces bohaiensis TaxID=1431344 RepID=UPI003B8275BB
MTDRRRESSSDGRAGGEPNPFAAPPDGAPDRPWHLRRRAGRDNGSGDGGRDGSDGGRDGSGEGDGEEDNRKSAWGRQWSSRQPGRQSGGFGQSPADRGQDGDREGRRRPGWDPADPRQRHARYALLAGGWAFVGAVFAWDWLALLLGALALYWGVDALRGTKQELTAEERAASGTDGDRAAAGGGSDTAATGDGAPERPSTPPAGGKGGRRSLLLSTSFGIGLASLAIAVVVANFTVQMVYKDYFDCAADALTIASQDACADRLPEVLHDVYIPQN